MKEIRTICDIQATAAEVWAVLMDFESYPDWHPIVRSIEGETAVGAKLTVTLQQPGRKATRFRPRLLAFEPEVEFRWLGRPFVPGLLDAEYYFRIEKGPGDAVRFVQGERFRGLLVPLFSKRIDQLTAALFETANLALKERVEARVGACAGDIRESKKEEVNVERNTHRSATLTSQQQET